MVLLVKEGEAAVVVRSHRAEAGNGSERQCYYESELDIGLSLNTAGRRQ